VASEYYAKLNFNIILNIHLLKGEIGSTRLSFRRCGSQCGSDCCSLQ